MAKRNIYALAENRTPVVQLEASNFTDSATPSRIFNKNIYK
jgi:hypothetical protein